MKALIGLMFVFFSMSANAACDLTFTQTNLCAKLEWKVGPQTPRESLLIVRFSDLATSTAKILDGTLKVEFFMPAHGHGTGSRQPKVETTGVAGEYLVKNIYLSMPGAWEVRFFMTNTAGQTEKQVLSIKL